MMPVKCLPDNQSHSFPREDDSAPRQVILKKMCPEVLGIFKACMAANDYNENNCLESKGNLDKCGGAAFKQVNEDVSLVFN